MPVGCSGLCASKLVLGVRCEGTVRRVYFGNVKNPPHVVNINKAGREDAMHKLCVSVRQVFKLPGYVQE